MASQAAIREAITKTIIEALGTGGLPPWRQPWRNDPNGGCPTNVASGNSYRGVNPLLLQIASIRHGFASKWWGTLRQWNLLECRIKKRPDEVPPGQWGTTIVFWKRITKVDEDGEAGPKSYPLLRKYTVFSIDQVEGEHLDRFRVGYGEGDIHTGQIQNYLDAKLAIEATGADIRHGGNGAYYSVKDDYIRLPYQSQMGLREYYETVAHELIHWACAESRLNWRGEYPLGELIAEIGSAFICSEWGIEPTENLENHAAYLQYWLEAMAQDSRYIFQAASMAARAADYVLSFGRTLVDDPELAFAE